MNDEELKDMLADHTLWLANKGGKQADLRWAKLSGADLRWADLRGVNLREANLSGADLRWAKLSWADLSWADLSGANLSGADLRWAKLREANLSWAEGITYAQCSFNAHGECGRQLSGVIIGDKLRLFCWCFQGTLAELDAYIDKGEEPYKPTRKLARDFIVAAIDAARKDQP